MPVACNLPMVPCLPPPPTRPLFPKPSVSTRRETDPPALQLGGAAGTAPLELSIEDVRIGPRKHDFIHTTAGGLAANPDSPPLVVLPGYSQGTGFWFRCVRGLAAGFRVYAIDHLGTGLSGRPAFTARSREEAEGGPGRLSLSRGAGRALDRRRSGPSRPAGRSTSIQLACLPAGSVLCPLILYSGPPGFAFLLQPSVNSLAMSGGPASPPPRLPQHPPASPASPTHMLRCPAV